MLAVFVNGPKANEHTEYPDLPPIVQAASVNNARGFLIDNHPPEINYIEYKLFHRNPEGCPIGGLYRCDSKYDQLGWDDE